MLGYDVAFEKPGYLVLLLLVPVIWLIARRTLAAMGRFRWLAALALRTALVAMLVFALAEIHLVRTNDRLAVVYVVDRSLSIPPDRLASVVEYVNQSIQKQRKVPQGDLAGVISFGANATVEFPPAPGDVELPRAFETLVQPDQTDLESALRLARAIFPPGSAKRVVVLSDGNQTLGDAMLEARALAAEGVGIDVVPLARSSASDIAVEKLVAPAQARQGLPFELRVVLANSAAAPTRGRLVVRRSSGGESRTVSEQPAEIRPGTQVFSLREQLDDTGFFTYEAQFIPDNPTSDAVSQNNAATAFAHVQGHGRVLVIVEGARAAEFAEPLEILRRENLDITVQYTNALFANLAELQTYDVVVLADVPRTGGDDVNSLAAFSDDQLKMLVENTSRLGCGLVMIGGPNSFGAGGWTNTPVEEAMPVDFQVKNAKVIPSGALMLVVDRSGSMSGEKIAMCRSAAIEAVKVLGPRDFVGVVAFDSEALPVVPISKVTNRDAIVRRISRLDAGGGTNMQPAMSHGMRDLQGAEAAVKHMIVLTDGQTQPGNYLEMAAAMRQQGMTVSAVAIGPDSDTQLLADIAARGGGKFYRVTSPRAVPRIFMREARRVARPLIHEDDRGFAAQVTFPHEILRGIDSQMPPLTGFVLTTPKENSLVEVSLTSPVPVGLENPILATWQYGLGRSAVWTTDFGARWTRNWLPWDGRAKLLTQLIRWAMRPHDAGGNYLVNAEVEGHRVRLVLTALDRDQQYVNFLSPSVSIVGPDLRVSDTALAQEAPGRYVGQFDAPTPGAYFLAVNTAPGGAQLRLGVNVGYSAEFRRAAENAQLLANLAALAPPGGPPGEVIALPAGPLNSPSDLPPTDVFRHDLPKAVARHPSWHWLLLAVCLLFVGDVFNRRVAWTSLPVVPALARLFRRRATAVPNEAMQRLRGRVEELRQQRPTATLAPPPIEPSPDAPDIRDLLESSAARTAPAATAEAPRQASPPDHEESSDYMSRLMKAKRSAGPRRNA